MALVRLKDIKREKELRHSMWPRCYVDVFKPPKSKIEPDLGAGWPAAKKKKEKSKNTSKNERKTTAGSVIVNKEGAKEIG